jgi:hypothetical protein
VKIANESGMDYALFEVFDEKWKTSEGAVGGYRGLYHSNGSAKLGVKTLLPNVKCIDRTLRGDFNFDGVVDFSDVIYVAYMVVESEQQNPKADFNHNGRVDIGDLAKISYYVLGKVGSL